MDLGEAALIDALVATWRDAVQGRAADTNDHARALDARVMAPVRALLEEDVQHIFLAPDGDLNLFPFAALVDEHDRFLVERYHITYLTSGRDLLRFHVPDAAREAPVIVAAPLYGTIPSSVSAAGAGNLLDLEVEPLPGTAREARALAALLPNPRVWTGAEATEARVAQLHGPEIVHIAIHGIWIPDVQEVQQDAPRIPKATRGFALRTPPPGLARTFDPMLRSGLPLAGFHTGGSGADERDDGFLSALEMTSIDLHGTRLVALSACDTGVGEAMRQVQLELLHDPQRNRSHPFFWASFIVSGNPAPLYAEPLDHPGRVSPTSGCACDSASSTPHLPTAVLMLLAVLLALRSRRAR